MPDPTPVPVIAGPDDVANVIVSYSLRMLPSDASVEPAIP